MDVTDSAIENGHKFSKQITLVLFLLSAAGILSSCAPSITSRDYLERYSALDSVTDEKTLLSIATTDPSTVVRDKAISKLRNQDTIEKIAIEATSTTLQQSAVSALKSQKSLSKVAHAVPSGVVHDAAIEKLIEFDRLTDPDAIETVALSGKCQSLKDTNDIATYLDQGRMRNIAINTECKEIAITALNNLNDQQLISEVAHSAKDPAVVFLAAEKTDDQALLEKFARSSEDEKIRISSILKLKNTEVLQEIALNDPSDKIGGNAASMLRDKGRLTLVSSTAKSHAARTAAKIALLHPYTVIELNPYEPQRLTAKYHNIDYLVVVYLDGFKLIFDKGNSIEAKITESSQIINGYAEALLPNGCRLEANPIGSWVDDKYETHFTIARWEPITSKCAKSDGLGSTQFIAKFGLLNEGSLKPSKNKGK